MGVQPVPADRGRLNPPLPRSDVVLKGSAIKGGVLSVGQSPAVSLWQEAQQHS